MSESGPEEDENGGFRVVDRRRFDADGSDRAEEESTSTPDPEPTAKSPESPETESSTQQAPAGAESRTSPGAVDEEPGAPAGAGAAPGEPPAPTFSSLILSLSTQALFSLGEIVESPDAEPRVDLVAGKQLIDLLGVLEDKTSGNLDADEKELMERILYDLRLRFVEIARGSRGSSGQTPEN